MWGSKLVCGWVTGNKDVINACLSRQVLKIITPLKISYSICSTNFVIELLPKIHI